MGLKIRTLISGVRNRRFLSPKSPRRLRAPPSLLFSGYRRPLPGVKRPGRGADHSFPYGATVKNECSFTSSPPYACMVWKRTNLPLPYV